MLNEKYMKFILTHFYVYYFNHFDQKAQNIKQNIMHNNTV